MTAEKTIQKRELRISQYKDYVAVDMVKDGKVLSTPFYLGKKGTGQIKYRDAENGRWYLTDVTIADDFCSLLCRDSEGFAWETPFAELMDDGVIKFI